MQWSQRDLCFLHALRRGRTEKPASQQIDGVGRHARRPRGEQAGASTYPYHTLAWTGQLASCCSRPAPASPWHHLHVCVRCCCCCCCCCVDSRRPCPCHRCHRQRPLAGSTTCSRPAAEPCASTVRPAPLTTCRPCRLRDLHRSLVVSWPASPPAATLRTPQPPLLRVLSSKLS
jgi:hypothetical protein